jgi:large subunit ribosomal protein L29
MKVRDIKNDLKNMNDKDLLVKIDALRRELFTLRLNTATAHVKDYSQFKKARKNIARALTSLRLKGVK